MVREVMRRDFVCADPGETLEGARQTMRMGRLRHLLVTRGDRLVGILSYRDLLESLTDGRGPAPSERVGAALKRAPVFVTPETALADAADRMCRYGFGCLPVLEPRRAHAEPDRLVGIVTERDLLRAAFRIQPRS